MRVLIQIVLLIFVSLLGGGMALAAGQPGETADDSQGVAQRSHVTVRTVDSQGHPIAGATVVEDVYGIHPKDYQPPTYATDTNGYVRLLPSQNSAGVSVSADGFFGAQLMREGLSSIGVNTVKLRRNRLQGSQLIEGEPRMPACKDLKAPAALNDADIISVIRTAVAAPGMRSLPRSVSFIRIEPDREKEGLARLHITFALAVFESYSAVVVRTKEGWRLEHAGSDVE